MGKEKVPAKKAAKKKAPAAKPSLIDDVSLSIESTIELHQLQMKGGGWSAVFTVKESLDSTHRHYKVFLSLNEKPDLDAIDRINAELERGLFNEEPVSKANAKKQIKGIEAQLEKNREICENIDFIATVFEIKYTPEGTKVNVLIPDTVIDALNRQKMRLGKLYKIRLEPTSI